MNNDLKVRGSVFFFFWAIFIYVFIYFGVKWGQKEKHESFVIFIELAISSFVIFMNLAISRPRHNS